MNTSHGYHIPGSSVEEFGASKFRARCGGLKLCPMCIKELEDWHFEQRRKQPRRVDEERTSDDRIIDAMKLLGEIETVKSLHKKENLIHDPVNHPKHYTDHPSGVECITVTRHMSFNLGNVVKYLWRDGLKDGVPEIQDLEKALWYLTDEIEQRQKNDNLE